MDDNTDIHTRFELLSPFLDERMRRLVAAAEAQALGHGGMTAVEKATGVSRRAIRNGMAELREEGTAPRNSGAVRVRRPGGGRKKSVDKDPGLRPCLDSLIDPVTRGDPESPLRWTCKSVRQLSRELTAQGHAASHRLVAELLHEMGYSLQANAKTIEGTSHPDRDKQFNYLNDQVQQVLEAGNPAISVDTKKKELVGDFKNAGREWRPKGDPEKVRVHDFKIPELGKATPYGVYDIGKNAGWVSVGTDHDTAEFAVATISRWWQLMGQACYTNPTRLLITADCGGSNGPRLRLWKAELQKFVNEFGFPVTVCHLPPGTSKWNKIEHRLFSAITQNWRGKPLVSHEAIVKLIAATTTTTGLSVRCELDTGKYPKARKISDEVMAELAVKPHTFHGEWNYDIEPSRNGTVIS